ncbi:hypothetical protein ACU4GD_27750 [Cupriavidus basilensis]
MSWNDRWSIDNATEYKEGGQGTVRKVVHKADGYPAALKEMHPRNANTTERRHRMAREVTVLKQLAGKGVPRLLESNIETVEDKSVPLYFICEWIGGKTLQEVAGGKPDDFERVITRCERCCRNNNALPQQWNPASRH